MEMALMKVVVVGMYIFLLAAMLVLDMLIHHMLYGGSLITSLLGDSNEKPVKKTLKKIMSQKYWPIRLGLYILIDTAFAFYLMRSGG